MKICLVSQDYPPETARGGIGSQTYLKAHGLAALGHEVYVISRSTDGQRQERKDGQSTVIRIPGADDRLPIATDPVRWLTYSVEVACAVSTLHAAVKLDIVDFPDWGAEGYIHLLNRAEWSRIPTVIQLHGLLVMFAQTMGWPELNSQLYQVGTMMEGTCLRLADAVFSSSAYSADWCAKAYGLKRESIPILHTGVDTRLFHPWDVPKDRRPTIVYVGRITQSKGVEQLIEATCKLAGDFSGLRLRLIGRGDAHFIERLQSRVRAAALPDLLDFPGFIEHERLPEQLSRAYVFAAPSAYEGGPGFVLEAMACGLPVIGCAGNGAAEVIVPEENGLLVPPGDVGALVESLRRFLLNPREREIFGTRARERVLREANSELCIRRLEQVYLAVLSGKQPQSAKQKSSSIPHGSALRGTPTSI